MQLNSFQKAKAVLIFNYISLFILIVLTPYFIKDGLPWAAETTVEGFFLAVELAALMFFFSQYDSLVRKKEEEVWMLDIKLKSKEKELLSAFQYLGKVNVQISMIKSLLEKMKIPSTRNQLREIYAELLRLVSSLTGEDCACLRIINIENGRTLSEHIETVNKTKDHLENSLGNNDLIKRFRQKIKEDDSEYTFFYSDTDNFSIKAFVLVPKNHKKHFTAEERSFLEAVANQCEIMFLLFNSRYYKG